MHSLRLTSIGDSMIEVLKASVLYRYWKPVCCLAWTFFILFEILMFFDHRFSTSPLCPFTDKEYGYWYWFCFYAVGGGFFLTWVALVVKIISFQRHQESSNPKPHAPLYVAFNVVSMSTLSTILALTGQMGICVDGLGGAYPAAIWGEWMACGPLLVFLTVTVIDKPELSFLDLTFIVSIFFCLLFAFFIIPTQPYESAVFWLVMSCLAYIPNILLPIYTEKDRISALSELPERERAIYQEKFVKRTMLAWLLTAVFALVVLNYFVAISGGYDHAVTIIAAQALSVLLKGPFSAMTMDVHVDSLFEAQQALLEEQLLNESRANEARRSFMKYIFHEVRTPLNSLTMGVDLLSSSYSLSEQDREYLAIMKASSEFMADTLDDVLSMHKIEEGKFELEFAPFSIRTVIARVIDTFRGSARQKNLSLSVHVSEESPDFVVGDMHRVEHVIANFLSNAIKFTPANKQVAIDVTCESFHIGVNGKECVSLKVAVRDEGIGISPVNQKRLFQDFVQICPSANQNGGGSGLGLALVKNVVEMHGGTVGVSGKEGEGSAFFFTIPFDIWSGTDRELKVLTAVEPHEAVKDHSVINVRSDFSVPQRTMKSNERAQSLLQATTSGIRLLSPRSLSPRSSLSFLLKVSPSPISHMDGAYAVATLPDAVEYPSRDALGSTEGSRTEAEKSCENHDREMKDKLLNKKQMEEATVSPLILVVDDAELNVKMTVMLLKRLGVSCDTAFDGAEAVRIATADLSKYQLVLMDNIMPEMTGVQAAAAMRQQGYLNLIVGLTGNVLEEDVKEYLNAGANFVLAKPLREIALKRLLTFVRDNGTTPQPDKRIIFNGDRLEWM